MRVLRYTVPKEADGWKLESFLRKQGYSRRLIIDLKKGNLAVNGNHRRMVDPVFAGDEIWVQLETEGHSGVVPNERLKVPVVAETEDFVVYDKPAGMAVHPSFLYHDDTLANAFAARYPGAVFRPLNRLDRDTTGLCLAAKNVLAAGLLKQTVEKRYYAVVEGILPNDQGTIDAPLVRAPGSVICRCVGEGGKRAVTHYRVLARLFRHTLVEVTLETGRTHQIRVHFSYLGFPLAGDTLYGGHAGEIARQALHCGKLWLSDPQTGERLSLVSPFPEDMQRLLG